MTGSGSPPKDSELAAVPTQAGQRRAKRDLLHPVAAATMLGLDWLVFTSGLVTGALSLPLASGVAALIAAVTTLRLQRRQGDGLWSARAKALLVGVLVALPLPIAGSAIGGWVLGVSGLRRLTRR